jgi:hypothetical protein
MMAGFRCPARRPRRGWWLRELKEWFTDDFNPHVVDVDWLSEDVAGLAQRWSRQPAAKRRRTG